MAIPAVDVQSAPPLVLLANDQEWSSRSLESVLGPRGFATVRAFTGRQALELVRTTLHQVIAEFPLLSVGLTYSPVPVGGFITLLFIVERLWIGDPPATSVMYRDRAEALE